MSLNFHTAILAASRRRGGAFDPLSLTPALWLDASDSDTLFDATSGGSTPTSGNDIARWEDKSGNDRHFTQSTAAACPHYQTAVQNGLAVARFDGSNDIMLGNAAALNILRDKPGGSIVACYRFRRIPTQSQVIFNITTGTSDLSARCFIEAGNTSRKSRTAGRRLDDDPLNQVLSSADIPITCIVHAGVLDYQNTRARNYINNSLDGTSDTFQTSGDTSDTDSQFVYVGANRTQTYANIDLSEIFAFDRAISDADRNALHTYLVAKWGIT